MPRKQSKLLFSKAKTEPKVEEAEKVYEIEAIRGYRNVENKPEFLVKWLGYSDIENTWEPLENLDNCPALLKEFLFSFGIEYFENIAKAEEEAGTPFPSVMENLSPNGPASTKHAAASSQPGYTPSSNIRPSVFTTSSRSASPAVHAARLASKSRKPIQSSSASPSPGIRRQDEIESLYLPHTQNPALKAFEDLFKYSRGPKIVVENTIDDAGRPPNFKYINDSTFGANIRKPDPDFVSSCRCAPGKCGVDNNCACMEDAKYMNEPGSIPYEEDGRVTEQANKMLWECNSNCGCGPDCIRNYSQRPRSLALRIKRFEYKGWGLVLDQLEPIPPRTFISRYVGEIITSQEAERRGQMYDNTGTTYLFDLDYNHENKALYSIDAYKQGNETHFINHSCDPNLSVYMLKSGANGGIEELMTLSFWSNRWIRYGDELTFDYTGKFVQSWKQVPGNSSQPKSTAGQEEGTTPCSL
ncbi:hypothetical protein BGX29_008863 [Mortierella sp. GBA35]|nr:hypothetical protein BGX29_008863 [Mortierella sp. GBA35]